MRRIKKGDQVKVVTGKDRNRKGRVLQVVPSKKLLKVEGINLLHHYIKPDPNRNIGGGIVKKEGFINSSKVMLINPVTNKADRTGFKTLEDGKKVRYFKSNKEVVDI